MFQFTHTGEYDYFVHIRSHDNGDLEVQRGTYHSHTPQVVPALPSIWQESLHRLGQAAVQQHQVSGRGSGQSELTLANGVHLQWRGLLPAEPPSLHSFMQDILRAAIA